MLGGCGGQGVGALVFDTYFSSKTIVVGNKNIHESLICKMLLYNLI